MYFLHQLHKGGVIFKAGLIGTREGKYFHRLNVLVHQGLELGLSKTISENPLPEVSFRSSGHTRKGNVKQISRSTAKEVALSRVT
eukprot:6491223-Amphidinium_carterae.1